MRVACQDAKQGASLGRWGSPAAAVPVLPLPRGSGPVSLRSARCLDRLMQASHAGRKGPEPLAAPLAAPPVARALLLPLDMPGGC